MFTPVVSCRANPIVEEENNQEADHVEEAVLKMAPSVVPEVQLGIWQPNLAFMCYTYFLYMN